MIASLIGLLLAMTEGFVWAVPKSRLLVFALVGYVLDALQFLTSSVPRQRFCWIYEAISLIATWSPSATSSAPSAALSCAIWLKEGASSASARSKVRLFSSWRTN